MCTAKVRLGLLGSPASRSDADSPAEIMNDDEDDFDGPVEETPLPETADHHISLPASDVSTASPTSS
jgi:hypothetical protein